MSHETKSLPRVEPWSWKYCSRQRFPVRVCWPLFLNMTLGCTAFTNSVLSRELGSSLWSSEHASCKEKQCSQGNRTSLSTLNKTFLSIFNFVPKMNKFLSKILPILHTFVKHKRYWTFNITQSLCVRRKYKFRKAQFTFENFLRHSCF